MTKTLQQAVSTVAAIRDPSARFLDRRFKEEADAS
jgi:hypothetical protein